MDRERLIVGEKRRESWGGRDKEKEKERESKIIKKKYLR